MKDKVTLAKRWANNIKDEVSESTVRFNEDTLAAGEVLRSLDSRWVEASKVREISAKMKSDLDWLDEDEVDDEFSRGFELATMKWLRELKEITPSLRTLADMRPEDRAECEWMQCDHPQLEEPGVILHIWGNGCHVVSREGVVEAEALNHVTPRPDLPRMQWPASALDERAPESASPRPEDVPVGEPWQVEVDGKAAIGYRHDPQARLCWAVVYRDDFGHAWLYDSDVTLIARLVPETTEQDDEPEFDPAYTYRDKDGDTWERLDGRWIAGDTHDERVAERVVGEIFPPGYASLPAEFGPYTRIEDTK